MHIQIWIPFFDFKGAVCQRLSPILSFFLTTPWYRFKARARYRFIRIHKGGLPIRFHYFCCNHSTMKTILSIFTFCLLVSTSFAQKQDVEVFEKKEGNKVIVMARNTGKEEYSVAVTIESKGMDVTPSSKVETSIAPGYMKEMANLVPRPGESWEYSYEVNVSKTTRTTTPTTVTSPTKATASPTQTREEHATTPTTTKTTTTTITPKPASPSPELSKANIILYSKPACGRCSFVKKQLIALNIPFEEYSTASTSPEINNMWAGLRDSGFTGETVTMPVVRVNGKYYYNIKDMQAFVNDLKKS